MDTPRVSVLMAVHNGERFLRQAIDSILNQTYRDFEFILVDDASTDSTLEIIAGIGDPRVRVIHSKVNVGAGAARNLGLEKACGEYIAILDADDVAIPDRLQFQVAFLDAHPRVVLVGTGVELIDDAGAPCGRLPAVQDSIVLRWMLYFKNPIPHSSVMYKRVAVCALGGYDVALPPAEDYALWSKLMQEYAILEIPQVLTRYRINPNGIARKHASTLRRNSNEVVRRNLRQLLGKDVSDDVAACLNGAPSSADAVAEAYSIYWQCVETFHAQQRVPRNHRPLYESVLRDLLGLARQDEAQRWCALAIAWRYGIRYAPLRLFTPAFFHFAARIIVPAYARRRIARPGENPVR